MTERPYLASTYASFHHPDHRYVVSFRHRSQRDIGGAAPITDELARLYPFINPGQIEQVFAFHESHVPLYGGRPYQPGAGLSDEDLAALYDAGIGFYMPLSNRFVDRQAFEASRPFLEKHHRAGNWVTCISDQLAGWIRRDFPRYKISASVIKNVRSDEAIARALDLYDSIVLAPSVNGDLDRMAGLDHKDRFTVFANSRCLFTCPSTTCYGHIAVYNRDWTEGTEPMAERAITCSRIGENAVAREELGYVVFDLNVYRDMGFTHFKVLPPGPLRASDKERVTVTTRTASLPEDAVFACFERPVFIVGDDSAGAGLIYDVLAENRVFWSVGRTRTVDMSALIGRWQFDNAQQPSMMPDARRYLGLIDTGQIKDARAAFADALIIRVGKHVASSDEASVVLKDFLADPVAETLRLCAFAGVGEDEHLGRFLSGPLPLGRYAFSTN